MQKETSHWSLVGPVAQSFCAPNHGKDDLTERPPPNKSEHLYLVNLSWDLCDDTHYPLRGSTVSIVMAVPYWIR